MSTVTLEGVTKQYENASGTLAVRSLNLTVTAGEMLALVGPSGCGKTTLLRMIAGLETPTEGSIQIAGRRVNDVPPHQRRVAMVFQNHALYPHLTVFHNIAFGLKMRRWPRAAIDARVRETAHLVGIDDRLDRMPESLSGGESQRVALARALASRPDVLLLDEPLSDLDAPMRRDLRRSLKQLQRELRMTTIYVTHDQEEAMALGDRIAVMADGVVQQCGAPLEVYRRPQNRFVARFIGQPPMNLIEGAVGRADDRWYFQAEGFRIELPPEVVARHGVTAGQDVAFGIRPESLSIGSVSDNPLALDTIVQSIEPLGAVMDVHVRIAAGPLLVARLPCEPLEEGDSLRLAFDTRNVRLFGPRSPAF